MAEKLDYIKASLEEVVERFKNISSCGIRNRLRYYKKNDTIIYDKLLKARRLINGDTEPKEYIGKRYGEYDQLEIIEDLGIYGKSKCRKYLVKCDICKNDPEMFGEGTFVVPINKLIVRTPCGCSKTPHYTQKQWEIRIKRACEKLNYTYIGNLSDKFSSLAKLHLRNNETGFEWKTTKVAHLMAGHGNGKMGGFSPELKGVLYLMKVVGKEFSFAGFGVTNDFKSRWPKHRAHFNKRHLEVDEYDLYYMDGWKAYEIEQNIRKTFTISPQPIPGFKREAVDINLFDDVSKFICQEIEKYSKIEKDSLERDSLKQHWCEPISTDDFSQTYSEITIPLSCSPTSHSFSGIQR